jgi:hypothetical protein
MDAGNTRYRPRRSRARAMSAMVMLGLVLAVCAGAGPGKTAASGASAASPATGFMAARDGAPGPRSIPWWNQAVVTAAEPAASDWFGSSVAISGDTALVGAPGDDIGSLKDAGTVWVYMRSGGAWQLQGVLTAAEPAGGDHFGAAVALAGDTALVGAPGDDIGLTADAGTAWVCERSGSTWQRQAVLTVAAPAAGDQFGASVALASSTALVGAPGDDVGSSQDVGTAWVFGRASGMWSRDAVLSPGSPDPGGAFGTSVDISGDTAIVGAPLADLVMGWTDAGVAWIFERSAAVWSSPKAVATPSHRSWAHFGCSVAVAGDVVVIGAPGDAGGAPAGGSAFVFSRSTPGWQQGPTLRAAVPAASDNFGTTVAIASGTVIVGAPGDDVGAAADAGSAWVFQQSGGSWIREAAMTAAAPEHADRFGEAAAISGVTTVVGAPLDDLDTLRPDAGTAWISLLDGVAPTTKVKISPKPKPTGWSRTPVLLELEAVDGASGVAATAIRPKGAAAWSSYAGPYTVSTEGISTFEFRSTDAAGNVEETRRVDVRIDTLPPTTRAYPSSVDRGGIARLRFRVDDPPHGSGHARVVVRVYRGTRLVRTLKAVTTVTNSRKARLFRCELSPGRYLFRVFASDLAGNGQAEAGAARLVVR